MPLSAGNRLGPYEVLGLLGAGGMGEVYRARDPRLGRDVALKVLSEEVARDPERLSRFEREARAVAALSHPNILTVFDVGTHEGTPYVVTELLEGETLRELVSRRAPTQRQVLFFLAQAAHGLEAAHAKGIVHRDVKPENLFVTTDGRVKLLDFGLAKQLERLTGGTAEATESSPTAAGQVVGTVAYMSPEQVRGLPVDHRTDIFSFGVLAYELLSGKHPFRRETTVGTLTAILEETPADLVTLGRGVPPALSGIVQRCLAKGREERFRSAHDLALSMESVLAAPVGAASLDEVEIQSPYPGLASFTERDAAVFFGREAEVAALWGKLRARKLLAVIAPSGAGKTSLVRAGVVATRPEGWRTVVCTPGASPFRGLGRALAGELSGDAQALGKLVDIDDPAVAFEVVSTWRKGHGEALLVVDQFEELFTLNPAEVQSRFAALLGRLAHEADVHVLLSLRDDFLIRCSEQEALAGVFLDLTPLPALSRDGLRRALVEPARKRGYSFEDEALVTEMVDAVEGARSALPLLAFAVSRLWEKRDRERKLLTRAAYEEIGGVAGALAGHAEATMDRIGAERQGIVREIFRNLVTAQGTRAVGEREELLSLFPDRTEAEGVLRELIDARLLTSFEVEGRPGESSRHRIEIAHESLLKAWPRLVRWQAQDEEGAVLRDQLKQAAHLWQEKGRTSDLLWTGTAFQEFELWRGRYAGCLTALEEDFARSMCEKARQRKRLVRAAAVAAVVVSTGVAIAIGVSRNEAVRARERAEEATRRTQASKLVALGRNQLDSYPVAALAYAWKSIETADNGEARRLAVEALWRGPTARILPVEFNGSWGAAFSPDGRRLAARTFSENLLLYAEDGSPPRTFGGLKPPIAPSDVFFTADGAALATWTFGEDAVRVLSTADGRELRALRPVLPGGRPGFLRNRDFFSEGVLFQVAQKDTPDAVVRLGVWPYDGGAPRFLGAHRGGIGLSVDSRGTRLVLGRFDRGARLVIRPLTGPEGTPERDLGLSPEGTITHWRLSTDGERLVVSEASGRLTVWELDSRAATKPRVLRFANPDPQSPPNFDPSGSLISWGSSSEKQVALWDLSAPPDAAPRLLRRSDAPATKASFFHPRGDWLVVLNYSTATFWSIRQPWPRVLRGPTGQVFRLAFTADSRSLLSCAFDGIHFWPIDSADGSGQRRISKDAICYGMSLSPDGREVLWGASGAQRTPLSGGGDAWLLSPDQSVDEVTPAVVIDRSGRRAATATGYSRPPARQRLRLWEWPSGRLLRDLPYTPPGEPDDSRALNAGSLVFAPDGRVIGAGAGGIVRFDPETGAREWLRKLPPTGFALFVAVEDAGLLLFTEADVVTSDSFFSRLGLLRLDRGDVRWITSHGGRITAIAIDRAGRVLVTGDDQGAVRVGRADGGEPHLLLGHGGNVEAVALSPNGRWVASASGSEIRLWPMPDLSKPPLHTLPHDELMAKLRALTNLRVVEDPASATGYKLEVGPFPGWRDVPTW